MSFLNKCAFIVCIVLASKSSGSQTVDATLADLKAKLTGHLFLVRNVSAQPVSAYHFSVGHVEPDIPPLFRSVAMFVPQEIVLDGSTIVIHGDRRDLLVDRKTQEIGSSPKSIKIALRIAAGAGDSASAVVGIINELLLSDVAAAVAVVPDYLRAVVPARAGSIQACKTCPHWIRQGSWLQIPADDPTYKPIRLVKDANPQMPDEARTKHVNAAVTLVYVIDEGGHPTEPWLTEAAGYGLDEAAVVALNKYQFRPATYKGTSAAMPVVDTFKFENH